MQCINPTDGNVGGLAVLVRSTSCIALTCQSDRNGLYAIEADLLIYQPPTTGGTSANGNEQTCLPGLNALTCVPHVYDQYGQITRRGGAAVLAADSKTIRFGVRAVTLCGGAFQQLYADIIIDPCEQNAIQQTDKGLLVAVKSGDCINLSLVSEQLCAGTVRSIKAELIIAPDPRNLLVCTKVGAAVLVRDTDCMAARVVTESTGGLETRFLEISPIICNAADNGLTCSPGGLGVHFGSSCSMKIVVEDSSAGCGASKIVRAYPILAQDLPVSGGASGEALNLLSPSAGGFGAFLRTSYCMEVRVAQPATGQDANGCGGIPRIIELSPRLDPSPENAMSCAVTGLGMIVQSTSCIELSVKPNPAGRPALHASVVRAAHAGNMLYCIEGCVGGGTTGGPVGLGVFFKDIDATCTTGTITFNRVPNACGVPEVVACVKLSTANGGLACNGLQAKPDGMWAPPDLYRGEGYSLIQGANYPDSGSTPKAVLKVTNCDPCRFNYWLVNFMSASGEATFTGASNELVEIDWKATVNGSGGIGQTNYFRMPGSFNNGGRVGFPGHQQWGVYLAAPGQSYTFELWQNIKAESTASVQLSDHRISAIMIPGPVDSTRACVYVNV